MEQMSLERARELRRIYPWFKLPRIVQEKMTGQMDRDLDLHFTFFSRNSAMLDVGVQGSAAEFKSTFVIENFLARKEVHIVSPESVTDEDMSVAGAEADDDIVSEELAEIYLAQGHKDMAREIYRKLSLLYPEKSVYFAELIEQIDRSV